MLRLTATYRAVPLCALFVLLGCGDDGGAGSGSGAGTGTSVGGGSGGGYAPDGDACEPQGCNDAEDCCSAMGHPGNTDALAPPCPGDYPFNWQCVAGECINPCETNADCIFNEFTCKKVLGGVNSCVKVCTNDNQCNGGINESCDGEYDVDDDDVADTNYCLFEAIP